MLSLATPNFNGLKSLIRELKTNNDVTVSMSEDKDIINLTIPALVKCWNGRKMIIVPGDDEFPEETYEPSALAKRLAQGDQWQGMIKSGQYPSISRLAEELRLDPSVVTKTINMVNLSPKTQKLIVDADTPKTINRKSCLARFRKTGRNRSICCCDETGKIS